MVDRHAQGMGEGVPGPEGSNRAALLDLDQGASGQAATAGQFVIGPAALAPQPRQLQTEGGEVRREDRHPTIRRFCQ